LCAWSANMRKRKQDGRKLPPTPARYVCIYCRSTFRRRETRPRPPELPCPNCVRQAVKVSLEFAPPAKSDVEQWLRVAALVEAGFRFERVGEPYPKRLEDVPAFVLRHR
jgi:hypothetical protein